MRPARSTALPSAAAFSLAVLAACGGSDDGSGKASNAAGTTIRSTDTACEVGKQELTAGTTTFTVSNNGTKVTEVYVYAPGDKIVSERENIGPGTTVELTVRLKAGKYQIACKPGMAGKGIRQDITVTGAAAQISDARLAKAVTDDKAWTR